MNIKITNTIIPSYKLYSHIFNNLEVFEDKDHELFGAYVGFKIVPNIYVMDTHIYVYDNEGNVTTFIIEGSE